MESAGISGTDTHRLTGWPGPQHRDSQAQCDPAAVTVPQPPPRQWPRTAVALPWAQAAAAEKSYGHHDGPPKIKIHEACVAALFHL